MKTVCPAGETERSVLPLAGLYFLGVKVRILVACEESQAVCNRMRDRGNEAYSCDIQECSGGHSEWHLQCDVTQLLKMQWDMVIAFPPCTHLAVSGAAHFEKKRADGRQQEGVDFFMQFTRLDHIPHVAIENPVGIMSSIYRTPNQIIHPWQFGHEQSKSTCLWLKGLPLLKPTNIVSKGEFVEFDSGKRMTKWFADSFNLPKEERSKVRSKTFDGIADAMCDQWTVCNIGEYAHCEPIEGGAKLSFL